MGCNKFLQIVTQCRCLIHKILRNAEAEKQKRNDLQTDLGNYISLHSVTFRLLDIYISQHCGYKHICFIMSTAV